VREELASIAPHADSEWLTADQCAAFLDVTRETVVTYARREGGLPCRYTGRSPVFKRAEVVAWLERRRESPSARSTRRGAQLRRIDGGR
jgi:hypothetical protein